MDPMITTARMDVMCREGVHIDSMIGNNEHASVENNVMIYRINWRLKELYRHRLNGDKYLFD